MVFILKRGKGSSVVNSENWGLTYCEDKATGKHYTNIELSWVPKCFESANLNQIILDDGVEFPVGKIYRKKVLVLEKVREEEVYHDGDKYEIFKIADDYDEYDYGRSEKKVVDAEEFIKDNFVIPNVIDSTEEMEELISSVKDLLLKWSNQ